MADNEIAVQDLWSKYEDIAMHFNDLLMRLRTQSLAGIAAVSTLVGLFTKDSAVTVKMDWLAATAIFIAMAFFWVAIFCMDFLYYNRLLLGAVAAIRELEAKTATKAFESINMSTTIEDEFRKKWWTGLGSTKGVLGFYGIVFFVIVAGAIFSGLMYAHAVPTSASATTSSSAANASISHPQDQPTLSIPSRLPPTPNPSTPHHG